jgi:regulation of enolase protein 1 (concanavalin A-like superfamily)
MSELTSRAVRSVSSQVLAITFVLAAVLVPRSVGAQALPSGWSTSDVGNPAVAGRAIYSGSEFIVEGAGADVWDPSDQFRFVYRQVTGDVTVVARVASLENTHAWTKSGVMIRESLAGNSAHAFALVSSGNGIAFQRRTSTGGTSASTAIAGTGPIWLRVQRQGNSFTASRSADGTNWTQIGTATVTMGSSVYVGLALTSHNPSTLASSTYQNVSVTGGTGGGGALPSGWSAGDIGSPGVAGAATYSSSTYTLRGAGADIWGTSDQFRFAYRQVTGDVNVVARVATLSGPDQWSKAGVMVRASLNANSAHASMFTSVSKGHAFQRRPGTGLSSLNTSGGTGTAPVWVKLERRGSAVTAFRSTNGTTWTMVGSETLTLPTSFYVGLAVTSHNTSSAATATFTNVTVGPSTPSSAPPTVSLTAPAAGATFTAPANITITANAADTDDGVAQVQFFANGALLGTDTSSPYSFAWNGVAAGSYSLTVVARDAGGLVTTSAARSITVNGGGTNTPPTVSLTAPASGATYTAPASITISANASDANGSVARVEFYAGSSLVGTDTSSPYSVAWNNVPAGSYSLTAVAYDNAGASTTAAARSVIVNNPTPPTRAIFGASSDHATVTRYVLDIFTAGANPNTATPMATQDLGKPSVVNGECTVNIATTINGLPSGTYFATVRAQNGVGFSGRAQSANFVR